MPNIMDISNIENTVNKVTSISADSTDIQYPSAKAVYSALESFTPLPAQSEFPDNLHNYVEVGSTMYLGRKSYTGTGYWGTEPNGGILIAQDENFASYKQMASRLGVSSIGKVSINLYPQWKSNSNIRVKVDDDWKNGKVWINVNGSWKKKIHQCFCKSKWCVQKKFIRGKSKLTGDYILKSTNMNMEGSSR